MKNLVYLAFLSFTILGCQEPQEELIDVNDLMGIDPEEDESLKGDNQSTDSTFALKQRFVDGGVEVDAIIPINDRMFPDRFGPVEVKKYRLILGSDTLKYLKWTYADSSKVMNAFYNWMDCFGDNCTSIFVGESRMFQKASLQLFVSDSTLIYVSGNTVDFDAWLKYHEAIGYEKDWNYLIEQRRSRNASWFIFEDEERIPYEEREK